MTVARSLVLRLLALVLALVQSASPALAAVADGVLAERGAGRPAVVHVEDRQQRSCPPVHAADCALCAYLSLEAEPASVGLPFEVAPARVAAASGYPEPVCALRLARAAARAPPGC